VLIPLIDRVWLYNDPGAWEWGRRVACFGGDEYGRLTLVVRMPGGRALVWAFWTCRCSDCDEMRAQTLAGEDDLRRVCDAYGITEEEAWELPGEAWNRVLGPPVPRKPSD
jgi:hypothetical protein